MNSHDSCKKFHQGYLVLSISFHIRMDFTFYREIKIKGKLHLFSVIQSSPNLERTSLGGFRANFRADVLSTVEIKIKIIMIITITIIVNYHTKQ